MASFIGYVMHNVHSVRVNIDYNDLCITFDMIFVALARLGNLISTFYDCGVFLGYVVELLAEMYFIEAEIKFQALELRKMIKVTKLPEEASETPIKRDNTPAQPEPTLKCWAFPGTQCAAQFG